MKNEKLVNAISELDDDLIFEAHDKHIRHGISAAIWLKTVAAAACLVLLIASSLFFFPTGKTTVSTDGTVLSSTPVYLQAHQVKSVLLNDVSSTVDFSVTLDFDISSPTDISVLQGYIQVYDIKSDTLLYVGKTYQADDNVSVKWTVQPAGSISAYKMTVRANRFNKTILLNIGNEQSTIVIN